MKCPKHGCEMTHTISEETLCAVCEKTARVEAETKAKRAYDLAYSAARSDIECYAIPHADGWYFIGHQVSLGEDNEVIDDALMYLTEIEAIEQHPTDIELVRFK